MDRIELPADALADVLALIDNGNLEATTGERAYIAGAIHGLVRDSEEDSTHVPKG